MKKDLILVGGGGHCKSCIDVIEMEGKYRIAGIVDVQERLHQKILGYEVIGTDRDFQRLVKNYGQFLVTVGQIKSSEKRKGLYNYLKDLKGIFPVIVSPLAYVSKHANIGEGTVGCICPGCSTARPDPNGQ